MHPMSPLDSPRLPIHAETHAGFGEVGGMLSFDGQDLVVEFQTRDSLLGLLQAVDVGTLLLQPQPSNTFSSYTVSQFGARALTLELGQARPFGQNQNLLLDEWLVLLPRLLQGQLPPASAPLNIRRFAVTREVIRSSEQFVLHLADDVANFTPLPAGYLLAEDGAQQTIVAAGEHILFPNPAVKVGLRAGVLVAAIDA